MCVEWVSLIRADRRAFCGRWANARFRCRADGRLRAEIQFRSLVSVTTGMKTTKMADVKFRDLVLDGRLNSIDASWIRREAFQNPTCSAM